ncbi:TetR/AcrR family transcriptional regulator [Smaragdicoccus niigatensis]|uniref:TetR/AcrR family transcriptional regulator n=1 Tax=Smaragdicoccus niigatensis TaxID=359359 RepID=UPI00036D5F29|nr:TetR/AcrR family transcriptional regulator [Smaragdicoccus niigatensis]
MARLTRAESQERTRRLLIESATKLFLRDGFRTTSLDAIGDEAGFSRGAVYSNFSSKGEIGIAVIDELYESALRTAVTAVGAESSSDPKAWIDALIYALRSSIGDPGWARLELEVAAAAQHGEMRAATAKRYANLRAVCESYVVGLFTARNATPPTDPQVLALAIVSVFVGFGLQRASDSSLPSQAIGPVLRLLLGD